MDPTIITLASPHHDLQTVGQYVVRENLHAQLREWQIACGANELFYLSTCQRVMWALWGGDRTSLNLPQALVFEREQAWHHLLSLASGLASANPGDLDIPTQIRRALEDALASGSASTECHSAMEDILREGSRLRSRLGLDRGAASVASVALKQLVQQLQPHGTVALVGTGAMTQYLAERLPAKGFHPTIVNRTLENAHILATPLGLPVLPLDELQQSPGHFDAVVTATGSPLPLFTQAAWSSAQRHHPLLLIDLALPPDSEEALTTLSWVHRVTLGECLKETEQTLALRRSLAEKATPLIQDAAERLRVKARHRSLRKERQHQQQEMAKAWDQIELSSQSGSLAHLTPDQREALQMVLQRGRTLAFRALAQGHITSEPSSNDTYAKGIL